MLWNTLISLPPHLPQTITTMITMVVCLMWKMVVFIHILVCTLKLNCGILHAFTKQKLVQASWKNWQRIMGFGQFFHSFLLWKECKVLYQNQFSDFLRTTMITDWGLEPFLRPAQLWTRPLLMRGNYNVHILGSCWGVVYGLLGICCRRGAFHNPEKKTLNPKPRKETRQKQNLGLLT